MPKTTKRNAVRAPAEIAGEKALREKYQKRRPSLAELEASGDYERPITQGKYWDLMRILSRLRQLRQEAGLSLADMAKRTGIDRAALSRLENAVNDNPSIQTLGRYADALGKRMVVRFITVNAAAGKEKGRKKAI